MADQIPLADQRLACRDETNRMGEEPFSGKHLEQKICPCIFQNLQNTIDRYSQDNTD